MKRVVDDLVTATEMLIAFLCAENTRPYSGFPIMVGQLPVEQRQYKEQNFYYVIDWGGRLARFG
jgi:hypothetical protein